MDGGITQVASLSDAYLRVRQSRKRFTDFVDRVERLRQGEVNVITAEQGRSAPNNLAYPISEPLDEVAILVSEAVQALLMALIYLVCALAKQRHPTIDDITLQFPICDRPDQFKRRVPSELKGLGKKEVALIEQLQLVQWKRMAPPSPRSCQP
jgi:hypothetical protein